MSESSAEQTTTAERDQLARDIFVAGSDSMRWTPDEAFAWADAFMAERARRSPATVSCPPPPASCPGSPHLTAGAGAVDAPPKCTGITAAWCPVHGDCKCRLNDAGEPSLDDAACPLHSPNSEHGEEAVESPIGTELDKLKAALRGLVDGESDSARVKNELRFLLGDDLVCERCRAKTSTFAVSKVGDMPSELLCSDCLERDASEDDEPVTPAAVPGQPEPMSVCGCWPIAHLLKPGHSFSKSGRCDVCHRGCMHAAPPVGGVKINVTMVVEDGSRISDFVTSAAFRELFGGPEKVVAPPVCDSCAAGKHDFCTIIVGDDGMGPDCACACLTAEPPSPEAPKAADQTADEHAASTESAPALSAKDVSVLVVPPMDLDIARDARRVERASADALCEGEALLAKLTINEMSPDAEQALGVAEARQVPAVQDTNPEETHHGQVASEVAAPSAAPAEEGSGAPLVATCPDCGATRAEVARDGHKALADRKPCPQACMCIPEHFLWAEHKEAVAADDAVEPTRVRWAKNDGDKLGLFHLWADGALVSLCKVFRETTMHGRPAPEDACRVCAPKLEEGTAVLVDDVPRWGTGNGKGWCLWTPDSSESICKDNVCDGEIAWGEPPTEEDRCDGCRAWEESAPEPEPVSVIRTRAEPVVCLVPGCGLAGKALRVHGEPWCLEHAVSLSEAEQVSVVMAWSRVAGQTPPVAPEQWTLAAVQAETERRLAPESTKARRGTPRDKTCVVRDCTAEGELAKNEFGRKVGPKVYVCKGHKHLAHSVTGEPAQLRAWAGEREAKRMAAKKAAATAKPEKKPPAQASLLAPEVAP